MTYSKDDNRVHVRGEFKSQFRRSLVLHTHDEGWWKEKNKIHIIAFTSIKQKLWKRDMMSTGSEREGVLWGSRSSLPSSRGEDVWWWVWGPNPGLHLVEAWLARCLSRTVWLVHHVAIVCWERGLGGIEKRLLAGEGSGSPSCASTRAKFDQEVSTPFIRRWPPNGKESFWLE